MLFIIIVMSHLINCDVRLFTSSSSRVYGYGLLANQILCYELYSIVGTQRCLSITLSVTDRKPVGSDDGYIGNKELYILVLKNLQLLVKFVQSLSLLKRNAKFPISYRNYQFCYLLKVDICV